MIGQIFMIKYTLFRKRHGRDFSLQATYDRELVTFLRKMYKVLP